MGALHEKSAQQITTYTIDINRGTNRQGLGWTALLQSMARTSDGKYFDVTSSGSQIVDALNAIFSGCRRPTACSPRLVCRSA